MSNINIRFATERDIPSLPRLISELGYTTTEEEIKTQFELINGTAQKIFVADKDGTIVGLMNFFPLDLLFGLGKLGRITALVVTENQRGQGIGKLLVSYAEELARKTGCTRLELTTNNRRIEAHQFYEHLGFEINSKRFVKILG